MDNEAIAERLDRIERLTLISAKTILDADEAATFASLSLGRIYRLTSEKKIPHYKRGNRLYFRKSELEEWLLETKVKTSEEIASEADTYTARRRTNRIQASRI